MNIFYAWQSDVDPNTNKNFIKKAIKSAISEINESLKINDSPRPKIKLDHDTKGIPGMPNIAETILNKINTSDIFIADITFIAFNNNNSKLIPNPNVVFELGYAFKTLGQDRILCVMNASFGNPDKLFFDIVHRRWPVTYRLNSSNSDNKDAEFKTLKNNIKNALQSIINSLTKKEHLKNNVKTVFTSKQESDFQNILDNIKILIEFSVSNSLWAFLNGSVSKLSTKYYAINFIDLLHSYINEGYNNYFKYDFESFCQSHIRKSFPKLVNANEKIDLHISNQIKVILRQNGLTKPVQSNNDPFTPKAYLFVHWLDNNKLVNKKLVVKKLQDFSQN